METYSWTDRDTQKAAEHKVFLKAKEDASKKPVSFINWSHILGNKLDQPEHFEDPNSPLKLPHANVTPLHTWIGGGLSTPLKPVAEGRRISLSEMSTPKLEPDSGMAESMAALNLGGTPVRTRKSYSRTTSLLNSTECEKEYTMAEVQTHCWKDDCWLVVDDVVYDATKFVSRHPGGAEKIAENAGDDVLLLQQW